MLVVDYLLDKMYESAHKVFEMGPPYLWGGDDPRIGLDCSGLASYVLGRMGWNGNLTGTRLSAQDYYSTVFSGSEPDKRLGPRADEMAAIFLQSGAGLIEHIGLYSSPRMVVHAASNIFAIPVYYAWNATSAYGLYQELEDVQDALMLEYTGDDESTEFGDQSVKLTRTQEQTGAIAIPEILSLDYAWSQASDVISYLANNRYSDDNPLDDNPAASATAALTLTESWLNRESKLRHAIKPVGVEFSGEFFEYDLSRMLAQQGIGRTINEYLLWRLGLKDRSDRPHPGVGMVSESKFIDFYGDDDHGLSLTVLVRYLTKEVVNEQFRVPDYLQTHYGPE